MKKRNKNKIKNVILITIDTLRADHVGAYGYNKNTTPFLDSLAKENIMFKNAYSNGPLTPRSFPSILGSTYSSISKQDLGSFMLSKKIRLISNELSDNGFETVAFQAGNPFISRYYGYNKGFDNFYDFLFDNDKKSKANKEKFKHKLVKLILKNKFIYYFAKKLKRNISKVGYFYFLYKIVFGSEPFIRAEKLNKSFFKWLNNRKNNNFFAWVHYMDVHQPHIPNNKYMGMFCKKNISKFKLAKYWSKITEKTVPKDKDLKNMVDLYDAEIRYLDDNLKILFKKLEKEGLRDNTLIIITSDHGDEFGEHGGLGHMLKLYNEMLKVPLLFIFPSGNVSSIETNVDLMRISPTILDVCGLKKPNYFLANSLKRLICGDKEYNNVIISESVDKQDNNSIIISVIKGKYKLIYY